MQKSIKMDILFTLNRFVDFSTNTFTEATSLSSLEKLKDEIKEVEVSIECFDDGLTEEYVDCLMCIFDSASRQGINPQKLMLAFENKTTINENRKCKKNDNNTYSHIK